MQSISFKSGESLGLLEGSRQGKPNNSTGSGEKLKLQREPSRSLPKSVNPMELCDREGPRVTIAIAYITGLANSQSGLSFVIESHGMGFICLTFEY